MIFYNLTSLKILDISGNDFRELPVKIFGNLKTLKYLSLSNSKMKHIPEKIFDSLTSLENLYIQNHALEELPEDIFSNLTSLRSLHLTGAKGFQNDLNFLPEKVFSNLKSLENLYLYANTFYELPKKLFEKLESLILLDLSYMSYKLKPLPEEIFSNLTSLEKLDLSKNWLEEFPEKIFENLQSLKHLDLSNCGHKYIPKRLLWRLQSLESLDMSMSTKLKNLPLFNNLISLRLLDISFITIGRLSEDIFKNLRSLEIINASKCAIVGLLPSNIFRDSALLKTVKMNSNSIQSVPRQILQNLRNLRHLDLSDNLITDTSFLHLHFPPKLEMLSLNNNRLRCDCETIDLLRSIANKTNKMFENTVAEGQCHNTKQDFSADMRYGDCGCVSNPCITGSCSFTLNTKYFNCSCPDAYVGRRCESLKTNIGIYHSFIIFIDFLYLI